MSTTKIKPNGVFKFFAREMGLKNPSTVSYNNDKLIGISGCSYLHPPIISPISEILQKTPNITLPLEISAKSMSLNYPFKTNDNSHMAKYIEKYFSEMGTMESIVKLENELKEIPGKLNEDIKQLGQSKKSENKKWSLFPGKQKDEKKENIDSIIDVMEEKAISQYNLKQDEFGKKASVPFKYGSEVSGSDIILCTKYQPHDFYTYRNNYKTSVGWISAKLSATLFPKTDVPQNIIEHPLVEGLSKHKNLAELNLSFGGMFIKKNSSDYYKILVNSGSEIEKKVLEEAKELFLVKDSV